MTVQTGLRIIDKKRGALYCSFCGKEKAEVGYLVAGPCVFICNECVERCHEIGHQILTIDGEVGDKR